MLKAAGELRTGMKYSPFLEKKKKKNTLETGAQTAETTMAV